MVGVFFWDKSCPTGSLFLLAANIRLDFIVIDVLVIET